jgi:hypothetical protein
VAFHGGVFCGEAGTGDVQGVAGVVEAYCAYGGAELGDVCIDFAVVDRGVAEFRVFGDLCAFG